MSVEPTRYTTLVLITSSSFIRAVRWSWGSDGERITCGARVGGVRGVRK